MKKLFTILFISFFIVSCSMRYKVSNGTVKKYHENGSVRVIFEMVDGDYETYKYFYESNRNKKK